MDELLAACSAALKDEACVLGSGSSEARRALVVVRGSTTAEIAIRVDHDDGLKSLRVLRFVETDAASERWRAAGLVVASLALLSGRESTGAPEPKPQPEPKTSGKALTARGLAPVRAPVERLGVWLAATAGSWAPSVPWLLGGQLGVEMFPLSAPIGFCLWGEASQALAKIAGSVSVSRQAFGVGIVTTFPQRARLRIVLRGQLERERLAATAMNDAGQSDAGQTLRTAGVLALAPSLIINRRLSAHVGAQLALYDKEPKVRVAKTTVAQASRVTASGFVGIRVGF